MGKILPILLGLIGLGAGIGAGIALKPAPEIIEMPSGDEPELQHSNEDKSQNVEADVSEYPEEESTNDFVKMNNQFVVPVVSESRVSALVVMSLSLEVEAGGSEVFYQREPKLRDAFLQVLFDHANSGGFDGVFTSGSKLDNLRRALLDSAKKAMGPVVIDVLVTDIIRQDI